VTARIFGAPVLARTSGSSAFIAALHNEQATIKSRPHHRCVKSRILGRGCIA
jgi:hypothetical protein